ncbi:MAG: chromosome segregation protein SMC [Gemmataceae bacterium]|nr:chromosome segregation protein SMC [Gemmataceae bacterium]
MLKKLELIGFKSFADKTAFDFAAGITAVVGPNGSGKSNVVDAVKWVLGEQSAKSLRGGAMADVIFNGSSTRKPYPHAEVTLTFDNVKYVLATDSAEVRITRRVYRDGQGEYLINGQVCRLKDIKDLFLGTGAGAGAYSIIEQGRVDALLQTAQDDRRAIFEEAAGVSRYKARKAECLRRLERVGQNLERLNDILGSVDTQLRSVRAQAGKAEKYREHANRLRELRVGVALGEYRELTGQLTDSESKLAGLREYLAEVEQAASARADQIRQAEGELASAESELHSTEQRAAELRHRHTTRSAGRAADTDRAARCAEEIATEQTRWRHAVREHRAALDTVATAEQESHDAGLARDRAEATVRVLAEQAREEQIELRELKKTLESAQADHLQQLRNAARWNNEIVGVKARTDQLRRERDRLSTRSTHAVGQIAGLENELAAIQSAAGEVQSRIDGLRTSINAERARRNSTSHRIVACQAELTELRTEAAGLNSRIEILEAWDKGDDGANAGIRFLFDRATELQGGVVAWVADALTADRSDAPLIDLVLGPMAQSFVVHDWAALLNWIESQQDGLPGRVSFIAVDGNEQEEPPLPAELVGTTSALAFVQSGLPGLAERLLGGTFIVDDIATARRLAARAPGYRFVTRAGELLEADGTLTLGTVPRESGVLSRKSELRSLRVRASEVAERTTDCESELAALEERIAALDTTLATMARESGVLHEQFADLASRADRLGDRHSGLQQELALSQTELGGLDAEIARGEAEIRQCESEARAAETKAHDAVAHQQAAEQRIREVERALQQHQAASTAAQVALAQSQERLTAVVQRLEQARSIAVSRQEETTTLAERIVAGQRRADTIALAILAADSELAELSADLEQTADSLTRLHASRDDRRSTLRRLHDDKQAGQDAWQKARDEAHSLELTTHDLNLRRTNLVSRFQDDYQIDLSADGLTGDLGELTPEQARAEAEDLRKKLARLGSVNLDALDELAQLEAKYQHLRVQFDDLTAARKTLEDIIHKINGDSKRLFLDTFAAIRVHFQDLFRRLFGGGMADIVLENPDDPLETPIDIVARPPGKELRSIALMSGGERTMTAVALLLAIFRSKPSPFCLLDEVDAALDEANTARLTGVLREFAATSQFIVITHAKRTMAAADVLYGVTMQESGISKRVAVRFDEFTDERRQAA